MEFIRRQLWLARRVALKTLVPFAYGAFLRKPQKNAAKDVTNPKRILLINGAHIGDVVIATSVIPILRSAFPSTEFGFVCGSWAQMAIKNHLELTHVHCVDHWRFNRSSESFYRKLKRFVTTRRHALREMREIRYDVAISLYTLFPDLVDLAWAAKIPVRIAFRQSFFAALATDLVDEPESPFVHQGARLAEALRVLPIQPYHFQFRHSSLAPSDAASLQEVCSVLGVSHLEDCRYRIVHMGSANSSRELPISFWRELAEQLPLRCKLLFTGHDKREFENIVAAVGGLVNCVNACGGLSWDGFVAAVRHAELLYGVESMAGHVAGAVGTPCAVVYGGAAGVGRWRPEGKFSVVFTNHVSCAPCGLQQGCATMICKQGISPDHLIRLVKMDEGSYGSE
jgi:ADP-heptose:LPS heptosyltransferase